MTGVNNPMLSVWMTTYNHERFISTAIESVLMQKTSFDLELVIGEDCSTDKTREIVLRYKEKYPGIIKLVLPVENIGMMLNAISTFSQCTGKYIAILEGDDYWIDPYKLQKQVDFLENNSDFVLSGHNANIIDNEGVLIELFNKTEIKSILQIKDIFRKWILPTASLVFRRESLEFPDWFKLVPNGDLAIILLLAKKGKINYFNAVMSSYRKHSGGASVVVNANSIKYLRGHKFLWEQVNKYYNFEYKGKVRRKIIFVNIQIMKQRLLKKSTVLQSLKRLYHYYKSF